MIEAFVRRKVTTAMVFCGVCLMGVLSLFRLPVQLLPNIEFPTLTVITAYPNAAPMEVENLVTRIDELYFEPGLPLDQAMHEVKLSLTACLEAGYALLHIDPTVDRTLPPGQAPTVPVVVARTPQPLRVIYLGLAYSF